MQTNVQEVFALTQYRVKTKWEIIDANANQDGQERTVITTSMIAWVSA